MKCLLVACLLLVTVFLAQAEVKREESIALLKKCKAKTNAPEDPEKVFDTQTLPESNNGKCMMACVLKEKGLMKNGKMDGAAMSDFFSEEYKTQPDVLEKVAQSIAECTVTVDIKGADECEVAYKYLKCGQEHGVKL